MQIPLASLRKLACSALLASALAAAPLAAPHAAPIPWANQKLNYTVVDQDLRDLLVEVGSKLNVPVQLTDTVKGHVHGRLPATRARAFLDNLCKVYGLVWYFDGATLSVSTEAESSSKLLTLGNVDAGQLRGALDQLGLADQRWPLRGDDDSHLVMVAGPPHYIASVEQTLAAITQQQRPQAGSVAVFHGRVADGRS